MSALSILLFDQPRLHLLQHMYTNSYSRSSCAAAILQYCPLPEIDDLLLARESVVDSLDQSRTYPQVGNTGSVPTLRLESSFYQNTNDNVRIDMRNI